MEIAIQIQYVEKFNHDFCIEVWTTPPAPETTHVDTTSHQPVSVELTPPDTSSLNATIHAPATLELINITGLIYNLRARKVVKKLAQEPDTKEPVEQEPSRARTSHSGTDAGTDAGTSRALPIYLCEIYSLKSQ
ncbi:20101_t:CDS:2 [Rhizophagus irregularis]|nr:20101_t:CDS:2 [Rhizophagus irregularis]